MNNFSFKNNPLNSLFYEIKSLINQQDGNKLSTILSLEKFSLTNEIRNVLLNGNSNWENSLGKILDTPWDDVVHYHFLSLQSLLSGRNYLTAFGDQCSMIQSLVKVLTQSKEENWMLPVVYVAAIELRKLAICADSMASTNTNAKAVKPDANIEEAASQLMSLFRACANDSRTSIEVSKRKGMMNIINQLFKIYFKINKLNLYKPLVRALENANIDEHFTLAERVTYSYFTGMKSLYDSDYRKADRLLSFAFEQCQRKMDKNRRIILIFLIPVKMLYSGCMPTKTILQQYDLLQFDSLCAAIREGNLYEFDQAIETNSEFFYNYGIYFTLEKLKILVYRNIFKKVAKIVQTHQIALQYFVDAINYYQSNRNRIELADDDKITLEEIHCLLANLIADNKLKGYISLQHQKLVISKQNPFPKLSPDV
ncbi:PCI domain-containing protein 2 [Dermatophagoides pteronyssinus]|uniref:CSN12-like protein n=2 Tax=Dermatophagoides pteronyssinus TaxID=6956 RepID=A0A6P6XSM7_DERPT|nr:PCI domain-containing protein 2-like [Dermatophagoides pteronyssinus]KAH9417741.1 PCI domain-containing protein 2 [Dermatophagoides pteronyssinus]